MSERERPVLDEVRRFLGGRAPIVQETKDGVPTLWVDREWAPEVLRHLKTGVDDPYRMLFDLTVVDERERRGRDGHPGGDLTVVYHLTSFGRNEDVRLKVPLALSDPKLESITGLWKNASWYEREAFDMFGVTFTGHPNLRRILMPRTWEGHPLRKDHPARATELPPYSLPDEEQDREQEAMRFVPEEWGLSKGSEDTDFLFLNLGPQHPGTHGVLRVILQLDGEEILDAVPDIGFHHRGAEKMGERQSWHTFIPYTDRIDYLGGVLNNLPYVMAVERLGGIDVPERAQTIRVMLSELFRISSHLVWYGTFVQDLGAMSPVFYTFEDRERLFDIIAAICGDRMHPNWFRIGGVAQDLPRGWEGMVRDFVRWLDKRLVEYDRMIMGNRIFKMRTKGVSAFSTDEAIEWGVTGPMLRATGLEWDWRKKRPYSGYEHFDFEIPTAEHGDVYDRAVVRVAELRQSLRIVEQCVAGMPAGDYKSRDPLATPPLKERTMHDIETLITHFLGVSWGPVIPPGEAAVTVEASKGANAYYLVSDGGNISYRTRIRTPSFTHLQMLPFMTRGHTIPDLLAILGSIDFVLSDVDR